jgi:hypothetical protein
MARVVGVDFADLHAALAGDHGADYRPAQPPGRARAAADERLNLTASGRAQPHRTADLAGGDFLAAAGGTTWLMSALVCRAQPARTSAASDAADCAGARTPVPGRNAAGPTTIR